MYDFLVKNGQQGAFAIGFLITIIFFVMALNGGDDPDRFNFGLGIAIALSILCAILMLIFGLFQIATDPKGSLKGIVTFGILIGLFVAMYVTSEAGGSVSMEETEKEFFVSNGMSKLISAGIWTTLILIMATMASFVFSEIRNFFK